MARPIQYDTDAVIEKAMQAFWEKGYHATSMANLVEITGLKPGSIYAAFHSKEKFFIAAVDHYGKKGSEAVLRMLTEAPTHLQGIRNFIQSIAEDVADPGSRRSCFLVNTVLELASQNEAAGQRARLYLDAIENHIRFALEMSVRKGEISPEKNPVSLAAFIMCNIWGLRVLGGTKPSPEKVGMVASCLLAVLD